MRKALLVGLIVAMGWAPEASAQYLPLDGKLYVDINGLYQATSQSVDQRGTFSIYEEEGFFETTQRIGAGGLWDVGFGYNVWRDLSLGLDIAQFSRNQTMEVRGEAPHPVFFNMPRAFVTEASSSHQTRTVAVLASWRLRMGGPLEKMSLRVMAGPAFLHVEQGLATSGTIEETTTPYSTVNATVSVGTQVKNGVGFVGGMDIAYPITDNLGAGLLLRYAGGSVKYVEQLGGQTVRVDAGGFQVGGGVRLRF